MGGLVECLLCRPDKLGFQNHHERAVGCWHMLIILFIAGVCCTSSKSPTDPVSKNKVGRP